MKKIDVLIVGAGAAGLMCAIEAGNRGRLVVVLDKANKPGKKILMSGGGRCNFTNYFISPNAYISHNPHFCKSALSRYTQWDFIELVKKHHIPFHEKTLGQLFCDQKSKDILNMLLFECEKAKAAIHLNTEIIHVERLNDRHFKVATNQGCYECESLVIASGGLSIPTLGASAFGYQIAKQFNIKVWPTRAGLVPFTLQEKQKEKISVLSGIALDALVSNADIQFRENMLFTHRGLSGPAILQISSYWKLGETVNINLLPNSKLIEILKSNKTIQAKKKLKSILIEYFPRRVIDVFLDEKIIEMSIGSISHQKLEEIALLFNEWEVKPNGTEGYRTAEVTLGGVDCDAISSKTMEAISVPGLYFIGEVLDVTGWLGGYNFQWAWSSGFAAGQVV